MGQIRHPNATCRSREDRRRAALELEAASDADKLEYVRGVYRAAARKVKAGQFDEGSPMWEDEVAPAVGYKMRYAKAIARAESRERDLKQTGSEENVVEGSERPGEA